MEATKDGTGLLYNILPPLVEDAGLEDCALPPDSIQEAFLKAASAVKSGAAALFDVSDDEADGGCLTDPWPTAKETDTDAFVGVETPSPGASDSVVVGGASPGAGSCIVGKGGGELAKEEEGGDAVVVVGEEAKEGERDCGGGNDGGLKGLGVEGRKKNRDKDEEEEGEEERPILVEGVV